MEQNIFTFSDKIKRFFYDGLDCQTSGCVYGSAATGNWVASRSDIDLVLILPEDRLEKLGELIKAWKSESENPILDGFAIFMSKNMIMAKRLEEYDDMARPVVGQIQLIDQWNIKNKSHQLFGEIPVHLVFPDIEKNQLRVWANKEINTFLKNIDVNNVPRVDVVLPKLIWVISWSARMLMLSRGIICDSKRDAMLWLANEHSEIKDLIGLLLEDYSKPADSVPAITAEQSVQLRKYCQDLLVRESRLSENAEPLLGK